MSPRLHGRDRYTAAPGLLVNRTYKIARVTTAAGNAAGHIPAQFDAQATGFTTTVSPDLCAGSITISQVYGGGGTRLRICFNNDFVELHNRGTTPVSTSPACPFNMQLRPGPAWSAAALNGTIGAELCTFLVQLASSRASDAGVLAPDLVGPSHQCGGRRGKVVLAGRPTTIPGGTVCPTGPLVLDIFGFGTTSTCFLLALASSVNCTSREQQMLPTAAAISSRASTSTTREDITVSNPPVPCFLRERAWCPAPCVVQNRV